MKKIIKMLSILLAMVALPMIFACSSDHAEEEVLDIQKAYGTWMCIQSTDTYHGQSHNGLLVGVQVTINKGGTYTSTSLDFGYSGTYTYTGNKITARNSSGDTFVVKVSINGDRMTWSGTASTGISFKYIFQKET